jgi:hypothetical protein
VTPDEFNAPFDSFRGSAFRLECLRTFPAVWRSPACLADGNKSHLGSTFLGLGGILLTQHLANRREDARWRRERECEQALWAREDAARLSTAKLWSPLVAS